MAGQLHNHLEGEIRPFIDLIDNLRLIGVQKDLNMGLPTIVVIGDQSSGKSSVLEALSGVALPRGSEKMNCAETREKSMKLMFRVIGCFPLVSHFQVDAPQKLWIKPELTENVFIKRCATAEPDLNQYIGIVTRCPLELKLKKVTYAMNWKATLSYRQRNGEHVNSSVGTSTKEAGVSYKPNTITFEDPSLVEDHVKEAQNDLAGEGAGICDELITLEIKSPDVCDLTLIDLPGIARVPVLGQPPDIGTQIKTLIMQRIRRPETLIMVVVPCNNDIATTEALKMAQEVDPEGTRTIAVLTKPDLIDKGTEKNVLAIAQNKVIPLHKGYIMVKCRGQQQIDENISLEEASEMERDFFKKHKHFRRLLTDNKATISCLSTELTEHLVNHIKKSLPMLDEDIKKQSSAIGKELNKIKGGPPQDPQGAKQYLIKTLTGFNDKIKLLSSGDLIITDNLYTQLRKEYKKWSDHLNKTKSAFNSPSKVKEQILKNRGRELAGFSSYRVFEMILQDHADQLKEPAIGLLSTIKGIILQQFLAMSNECFQRYPNLLKTTMTKIEHLQSSQQSKTEERILEQFEMENIIFTQDDIYFSSMSENGNEIFSEAQLPFCNVATKYSDMLKAYNKIMVKRMSDQVPMLVQYFMLKEASELLCIDMLTLLNEADAREMLSEDSDVSRRRIELQSRLERLSNARKEINKLI